MFLPLRGSKHRSIRNYEWVLNWSFQFSGRPWDVVPVLPSGPSNDELDNRSIETIARQILVGKDVRFIDGSSAIESWIDEQKRVWRGARGELPPRNDFVFVWQTNWRRALSLA